MESLAWELYCQDTEGSFNVADFWKELSKRVQDIYLQKAKIHHLLKNLRMDEEILHDIGYNTSNESHADSLLLVESHLIGTIRFLEELDNAN